MPPKKAAATAAAAAAADGGPAIRVTRRSSRKATVKSNPPKKDATEYIPLKTPEIAPDTPSPKPPSENTPFKTLEITSLKTKTESVGEKAPPTETAAVAVAVPLHVEKPTQEVSVETVTVATEEAVVSAPLPVAAATAECSVPETVGGGGGEDAGTESIGEKAALPPPAEAAVPLDDEKPNAGAETEAAATATVVSAPFPMASVDVSVPEIVGIGGENAGKAKTLVKKKVRIVKKVVKKLVPKRVVKNVPVCSSKDEELGKAELGNGGEERNSAVLDSMKVEKVNSSVVDAMEDEKMDTAVSMEVDNANTKVVCSVDIEKSESNVSGLEEIENLGNSETCEGEKEGTLTKDEFKVPVLDAVGDNNHGLVVEKEIQGSDVPVKDKNVDSVGGGIDECMTENEEVGGEGDVGGKEEIQKKVRIVKKVVKKLVPKRVVKSVPVCSSKDKGLGKAESGNGGEERNNSAVSDSMEVEKGNSSVVDAMESEKIEPAVTVSMEVDNANTNVAGSVEIEKSEPNVSGSVKVENLGKSETWEGEKECTLTEDEFKVPVLDAIGDNNHGLVVEKEIQGSDGPLEDKNVDLVGGGIDECMTENVEVGGEVDAGVKEEMENGDAGGSKEEVEMGNGLVGLSEEMEALERRRRRRTEIFIGGLDQNTKEEDIRKVFEELGEVVEVRMILNAQTKKNKGYAFVRYASASDAKKALTKYQKVEIGSKLCGVAPVEGNDTIFLGNIDKKWKDEDVSKLLREIGIDKLDKVTVMVDSKNIKCNRGFAFLEFETNKDAQNAYKKLQKKDAFGKHYKIKVAWAEPLKEPDEEEMQKVKSVYAGFIPSSWDEEKVRDYFKKFGEIENVILARNLHFSKRKDFAFVNYTTREAALACVESLNQELSNDEKSKGNVKVSLAIPLQKGKQNKWVSNSTNKEPTKEKPKPPQRGPKPNNLRNKGKFIRSEYEDRIGERRYSKNAELVHLSREQPSWGHSHTGVGIGSVNADYRYTSPGMKRPYSSMEDGLYSDSRGYPRMRLESSYPVTSSRYSAFSQGVGMESLPYHQRQSVGFSSAGSINGITDHAPNIPREAAPYRGSSGRRYLYL